MNPAKLQTALETLDELGLALQASDLARAETCRTFLHRILTAAPRRAHPRPDGYGAPLQRTPAANARRRLLHADLDAASELAAAHYGLKPSQLWTACRRENIATARQLVWFLLYKCGLDYTLAEIGAPYGFVHGTVLYGIKAVEDRISIDPSLASATIRMLAQLTTRRDELRESPPASPPPSPELGTPQGFKPYWKKEKSSASPHSQQNPSHPVPSVP